MRDATTTGTEEEFEDLPPGAYLQELRVGGVLVAWSLLNLLVAVLVLWGWLGGSTEFGAGSPRISSCCRSSRISMA